MELQARFWKNTNPTTISDTHHMHADSLRPTNIISPHGSVGIEQTTSDPHHTWLSFTDFQTPSNSLFLLEPFTNLRIDPYIFQSHCIFLSHEYHALIIILPHYNHMPPLFLQEPFFSWACRFLALGSAWGVQGDFEYWVFLFLCLFSTSLLGFLQNAMSGTYGKYFPIFFLPFLLMTGCWGLFSLSLI